MSHDDKGQALTWLRGTDQGWCRTGKPRVPANLGFVAPYRQKCDEVAANGYEGFVFDGAQLALFGVAPTYMPQIDQHLSELLATQV